MAEVLFSRFVHRLEKHAGTFRPKAAAVFLLLAGSLSGSIAAQSAPAPQAKRPTPASSIPAPVEPQSPPPSQIWLPPLQAPAHHPIVDWDGKLLTIDADNSSLADILLAIRSRTGALIDMPASAKTERIAVHLGPARIREAISALLYGTDFNYVIQAADDGTGLDRVIVTGSDDQGSLDTLADDARSSNRKPRVPGWGAPGKRDFQRTRPSAPDDNSSSAAEPAYDVNASAPDQSAVAADSPNANAESEAQSVTVEPTNSAPSGEGNSSAQSASDQSNPHDGSGTASEGSSGETSSSASPIADAEHNLQKMYQERQQMQAQQNRAAQTPPQ